MKIRSKILVLVLACMMLLTSCGTDDKKEENKATAPATETTTATAVNTDAPTATATIEPTTEATKVPVTETPDNPVTTEETTATTKPTVQPVVTDKPTKSPTIIVQPTAKPTTKPNSTAKPTESTTPDTSWGKNDIEKMVLIPPPFTDITDWVGEKISDDQYHLKTATNIDPDENNDCFKIIEAYAKSYESYGYTVVSIINEFSVRFNVFDSVGNLFEIGCAGGYAYITIYPAIY